MAKPPLSPFRLEAEAIAARLLSDHPPELIAELQRVLAERAPNRGGRPEVDDTRRLRRMAEILYSQEVTEEPEAARIIAHDDPGKDEKATARRILRKFREDREALLAAARRAKDLESDPAFAEEVEQWDL